MPTTIVVGCMNLAPENDMNLEEMNRRYKSLSSEIQARTLVTFGHNLTIAARDTYEIQAPGVTGAANGRPPSIP